MRFFFRSKQFKIILAVFLSVVVLTVAFRFIGQKMAPTANIAGAIAAPFQSMAKGINDLPFTITVMRLCSKTQSLKAR